MSTIRVCMIFCKQSCICLTNLHRQTDSQKTNQLQNKQVLQYYAQDCKSGWEEHKNLGSVPGLPVCLFILLKSQKQPHVSTNEWSQMCSLVLSLTTHPFRNLTVDLLTLPPFFCFCFFFFVLGLPGLWTCSTFSLEMVSNCVLWVPLWKASSPLT